MNLPYDGRRGVLATQHGKEQALADPLARLAGLSLTVPPGLDTDVLGTFTGEVSRPADMRETARRKAALGMAATGLPVALASEGSFGPHPLIPFAAAGHEMLLFCDNERGVEVVESSLSQETNFAALDLAEGVPLAPFLERAGFPAHALVLRVDDRVTKGIRDRESLERAIAQSAGALPLRLETDMRAHMNPTRMREIGKLGWSLARRLATPCPVCATPGFGHLRSEPGLPCAACGTGTRLFRARVMGCNRCGHEQPGPREDGRITATPAECQECNP